jgi:hypothetical protein
LDVERQNGVFNSTGARTTDIGFSAPLELAGQRGRSIDLARAELEAAKADVADRELPPTSEARKACVGAPAAPLHPSLQLWMGLQESRSQFRSISVSLAL